MGGIVDYLNSIGKPSSKEARKKLAEQYGIENYDFSAEKNTELLNKLKANSNGVGIKYKGGKYNGNKGIGVNPLIQKAKETKKETQPNSDSFSKNNNTTKQINDVINPSKPIQNSIGIKYKDEKYNDKKDYFGINPLIKKVQSSKQGNTPEISGGKSDTLSSMDSLLNKAGKSTEDKLKAKDDLNKGILKGSTIGSYAVDAAKGINGIIQFIKGKKTLKGLEKPKYPEYLKNQLLSTRIAEAQQQAQMADPLIRSKGMSDLANQRFLMDNVGKAVSGGDISSYGAFAQANADNASKTIKDIMREEIQNKMQKQQILDNLINQGQQERQFDFNSRVNKFNQLDYPEFEARRGYGEKLINTGISNIYGAGESMANNSPLLSYMKALNMKKTITDREKEKRMRGGARAMGIPSQPIYPTGNSVEV